MKNPKYILNRIINAFINGYYGRTPHYWERGKYNKAYKLKRKQMKQYRIVQKIYKEGTKYQESIFYPQVMDSHTLNNKIDPWDYFYKVDEGDVVCFRSIDMADEYIENQKLMDIPVKTIIHPVN